VDTLENKVMSIEFASSASSSQPSGNPQVESESWTLASAPLDKTFVLGAANTLQALVCLNSLTAVYADDSVKVRVYAKLVDEKLQVLGELMRPMLWSRA
jgi:hypothetical protein